MQVPARRAIAHESMELEAWLWEVGGKRELAVTRSHTIEDQDPVFAPVRALLEINCHLETARTGVDDESWMGVVELTTYALFEECPGSVIPHCCLYERKELSADERSRDNGRGLPA